MTDTLQAKFDALESQLTTQNTALLSAMGDISTLLELINSNASLNAQRMLAALAQNSSCAICNPSSISPPAASPTIQAQNSDHCKRMQALIYALEQIAIKLDVLSVFSVSFNAGILTSLFTELSSELTLPGSPVLPSFAEVSQLALDAVYYIASNVFAGEFISDTFGPIASVLLGPLYSATNAADGLAAYHATVNASSAPAAAKAIINDMAYAALFDVYYDHTNALDTTGFDGSICSGFGVCFDIEGSPPLVTNFAGTFLVVQPTTPYGPNPDTFTVADWHNYTVVLTSITGTENVNMAYYDAGGTFHLGFAVNSTGIPYTFPETTLAVGFYKVHETGDAYVINVCPPGA